MHIFTLEHVGVQYDLHAGKDKRLGRLFHGRRKKEIFHALESIDATVQQGEIIGLIGRNGAGKSTLLKVLSGVVFPTSGTVWRNEKTRIFPLLSLGVGFFPDLTGRENCFLSGALLGMTPLEVESKLQAITEFAELDRFFDEPVKNYSSGMYARLAFSLATSVNADTLLIDEVLGVGDMRFALKCAARMQRIMTSGATIVIVSHNVDYLSTVCTRMIWLEKGRIVAEGAPHEVARAYQTAMRSESLGQTSFHLRRAL